jgi:tryptophanyl-tRNA synthetase
MKAKSDTEPTIGFDREKRPEASNLLTIYAALDDRTVADVLQQMEGKGFAAFKKDLADLAIAKLAPVTERMRALLNDRAYLDQVLQRGAEAASEIAAPHCRDLQEKLGFWTITSHAPAALAVGF